MANDRSILFNHALPAFPLTAQGHSNFTSAPKPRALPRCRMPSCAALRSVVVALAASICAATPEGAGGYLREIPFAKIKFKTAAMVRRATNFALGVLKRCGRATDGKMTCDRLHAPICPCAGAFRS